LQSFVRRDRKTWNVGSGPKVPVADGKVNLFKERFLSHDAVFRDDHGTDG
jgi:hypothetical protein